MTTKAQSNDKPDAKVTEEIPEHLRWKGEGPPPASWYVDNTKVYRSYEDYCDD